MTDLKEQIASILCTGYPCSELKNKELDCPDKTCIAYSKTQQIISLLAKAAWVKCPHCHGISIGACPTCHGTGKVPAEMKRISERAMFDAMCNRDPFMDLRCQAARDALADAQLAADQQVQAAINAAHAEELAEKDKEIEKLKTEKKEMIEELEIKLGFEEGEWGSPDCRFITAEQWQSFKQEHGG